MSYFRLANLLDAFQTSEHPFRAICLLATQLGHSSDRNELSNILNIINSWLPLDERIKRGKVRNALNALEAALLISSEQDRFGKSERSFFQITNLGRATLLFLLNSSGFLTTIRNETLQQSWEEVDQRIVLIEALSLTLKKLRPYRELHQALRNRSMPLPTTAKKYFLTWRPEKILGVKTVERLRLLECLIQEQVSLGMGLTSSEIDNMLPDLPRASNKVKKLGDLIEIDILKGEGHSIYRLSTTALHCLFALGLMILGTDPRHEVFDPRSLLIPPTRDVQINRHLASNALDFFKGLMVQSF